MKRFLIITTFAVAVAAFPVTHDALAGKGGNSANQFCTSLAERRPALFDFLYDSHGDCVSRRPVWVRLCQNRDILQFAEFRNQGQCVKFFRSLGG